MINRYRLAIIAGAPIVALAVGCASSRNDAVPAVPAALAVPATQQLALATHARGVQVYRCQVSAADPGRYEWVFKAPEADLYDRDGARIGRHYAGPTWESTDGSKVVGEVKAQDAGPDPAAIAWLLLSARSASGPGILGQTTSIQRLQTSGGKAPAQGCSAAQLGQDLRVDYKAAYYFYMAKP